MDMNSKSNMPLDKAIEVLESRAEYERLNKNYEARHDYVQLVEWLKELKKLRRFDIIDIPKPKTGHWEYGYAFADGNYCKCSECKEIIKCIYPMHYCPNCGCRMVEPRKVR